MSFVLPLSRWRAALLCAASVLSASAALSAPPLAPALTLTERMQLFRDGALRGFALAELPESGIDSYSEADFQDLAATGANVVRVSISLRKCSGCERYDAPEAALSYVERILERGHRLGFRVVVTLLPMPGFSKSDYWGNPVLQADIVHQWAQVASRLKRFPALQAYDLINEPVLPDAVGIPDPKAAWHALAAAIAREVRGIDPNTPLMIEPTPWGLPGSFKATEALQMPGLVYSFHLYAPHEFTHQGLPGYADARTYPGNGWDKTRLSKAMAQARRFAAEHRVPMFVGEFSCVRWAPSGSCPRYLADALALFEAEGWGWTYHCWRCYQGWDAELPAELPPAQPAGRVPQSRRPDSPSVVLLQEAMQRGRARPK